MTVGAVVVFEEDVLRLICKYAPQYERSCEEKQTLYGELKCEWDMHSADALVICLGDINGHVGKHTDVIDGVHGGCGVCQSNLEVRMSLVLYGEINVCQIHGLRKRKVTYRMSENKTEIDFMLIKKEHRLIIIIIIM